MRGELAGSWQVSLGQGTGREPFMQQQPSSRWQFGNPMFAMGRWRPIRASRPNAPWHCARNTGEGRRGGARGGVSRLQSATGDAAAAARGRPGSGAEAVSSIGMTRCRGPAAGWAVWWQGGL